MKSITVKLAGRNYDIQPRPIREARRFREKFSSQFGRLAEALRLAPTTHVDDLGSMAGLVDAASSVLLGSIDMAMDMLCEYSADVNLDRERIEADGYDDEVITAFVEVIKLLYPLGSLSNLLNGQARQAT
jgi:hypothetical protein